MGHPAEVRFRTQVSRRFARGAAARGLRTRAEDRRRRFRLPPRRPRAPGPGPADLRGRLHAEARLHPGLPSVHDAPRGVRRRRRSEEHTSELQSPCNLVCRLLLEKKKNYNQRDCTLLRDLQDSRPIQSLPTQLQQELLLSYSDPCVYSSDLAHTYTHVEL